MNKLLVQAIILTAMIFSVSCSDILKLKNSSVTSSKSEITDILHTNAKEQTIGNCWVYAAIGLVESLILNASDDAKKENFSETYISYWHLRDQLINKIGKESTELISGGYFLEAVDLIKEHGLMREGDFIEAEANSLSSETQEKAFKAIEESLKSGPLNELISNEEMTKEVRENLVDTELRKVFGLDINELKAKVISGDDVMVKSSINSEMVSLNEELSNWSIFSILPKDDPNDDDDLYDSIVPSTDNLGYDQKLKKFMILDIVLYAVKDALNNKLPALISWNVEMNALKDGVFSIGNLKDKGVPGEQGRHVTAIEDYTVTITDPETSEVTLLGEGDLSQEQKDLALQKGELNTLIIKNSWGSAVGSSYEVNEEYGYHKLTRNYLFTWIKSPKYEKAILPLQSFILPKNYIDKAMSEYNLFGR